MEKSLPNKLEMIDGVPCGSSAAAETLFAPFDAHLARFAKLPLFGAIAVLDRHTHALPPSFIQSVFHHQLLGQLEAAINDGEIQHPSGQKTDKRQVPIVPRDQQHKRHLD